MVFRTPKPNEKCPRTLKLDHNKQIYDLLKKNSTKFNLRISVKSARQYFQSNFLTLKYEQLGQYQLRLVVICQKYKCFTSKQILALRVYTHQNTN
jgi:hypothetical protein